MDNQNRRQKLKGIISDRIYNLIKDKKEETGQTQAEQAQYIKISESSLSKYANVDAPAIPDGASLYKMAKFYNCSVDYILGRTKNPSPEIDDIEITKKLGISNGVIYALKELQNSDPHCDIAYVLNYIFDTGYGYKFLSGLSHYFFAECDKFRISNGMEIHDNKNVMAFSSDMQTTAIINPEDVEFIFQQKLYKTLSEIKEAFKSKKLECPTDNCDGMAFLDDSQREMLKRHKKYKDSINGKHTTKKK